MNSNLLTQPKDSFKQIGLDMNFLNFNVDLGTLQLANQLRLLQQQTEFKPPPLGPFPASPSLSPTPNTNKRKATESAASSSVNGDSVSDEEKVKKRRSQIAAASRKSRAKRKNELLTLRKENERLWQEVRLLKSTMNVKLKESKGKEQQVCTENKNDLVQYLKVQLNNTLNDLKKKVKVKNATREEVTQFIDSLHISLLDPSL